jgi:peptidoglycan/xylan/chitin deacetylase (PgdA/CDA1 family)
MSRELILTFHGLGQPPKSATDAERKVWVPVAWFEAILDALPTQGVRLAFDDGNVSDVEQALPVLVRKGQTARFFLLGGKIGVPGYVDAEGIGRLCAAGMGVGSHGCQHRDWRALTAEELDEELVASRRTFAEVLGHDVTEAACPFGSYDRRVLRALRRTGYRRVYNSDGGTCDTRAWLASRTTVDQDRPLQHWLDLAAAGAHRRPGLLPRGKRLVKRLR